MGLWPTQIVVLNGPLHVAGSGRDDARIRRLDANAHTTTCHARCQGVAAAPDGSFIWSSFSHHPWRHTSAERRSRKGMLTLTTHYAPISNTQSTTHPPHRPSRAATHLFAPAKGDVAVLDHVEDLLLHGHREEHEPVHDQDGPKHRNVKGREEGRGKAQQKRAQARVPRWSWWWGKMMAD